MVRNKTYTLTKRLYASMRTRYGDEYRCSRCDGMFRLNDTVVPKSRKRKCVRWFHEECFESLLL